MFSVLSSFARRSWTVFAGGSFALVTLTACSSTADSITAVAPAGPPTSIQVSTNGLALDSIGAKDSLRVLLLDAAGQPSTAQVSWSSANAAIAEISANGIVIGRAAGITTVRATAAGLSATVDVRVLGVRGLTLAQSAVSVRVGDEQTLSASFDADANASQQVRYSSSNPAIASVDANGVVTGRGAGVAKIVVSAAADPRVAAIANVTVNPARAVSFAPGGAAITLWRGDSRAIAATIDVDSTESRDIVWSSGNPAVATVAEDGTITAVGEGTAIIRAASIVDPRARAELVLTVLPARRVAVTPDSVTLSAGATQQFSAAVTIEAGLGTSVVWTSSDTAVATVDSTGLVTAVADGYATITATSVTDPTRRGNGYVTVSSANSAGVKARAVTLRKRESR